MSNKQTRLFSFLEVATGRVMGYTSAVCLQMFVFPLYGWNTTWGESAQIGAFFTLMSLCLSFGVRRLFEMLRSKGIGVEKNV